MEEILNTSLSFILGFITAIFADPIKKWLEKIKLSLSFEPSIDIITTPDGDGKQAIYVRVKVSNHINSRYARQIAPYLVLIERKLADEQSFKTIFDTPLILAWSYRGHVGTIDLPPKMWAYFDVVKFDGDHHYPLPATIHKPLLWKTNLGHFATYRLTFCVSSENTKQILKKQLTFKWTGKWNEVEDIAVYPM